MYFTSCGNVNLNGDYKTREEYPAKGGLLWHFVSGTKNSLKYSQMKVRKN